LEQATGVANATARRLAELKSLEAGFSSNGTEAARDQQLKRLEVIFGNFRALPHLKPGNAAELAAMFNHSDALQAGQPHHAAAWFRRSARVRAGTARLGSVLSYAAALGRPGALDLSVGQLPFQPDDRWVALPALPGQGFPAGKTSLVAHLPDGFDPAQTISGLLVDEWAEVAPNRSSLTGVAFHFDAPGARPPQAILLAVSPSTGTDETRWDLEDLESTLLETQQLARLRAADPQALAEIPEVSHFVPALYFGLNLSGDTVSTDFRRAD
jgi:hypothetical protein